jgi:hypothetical protein
MLELVGNIHICTSDLTLVVGDGIHMTTSIASPTMTQFLSEDAVAKFHVVLKTDSPIMPASLSTRGRVQIFISAKISPSLKYHYPLIEVTPGDWWVHHGGLTEEVALEVVQAVFGGSVYVIKVDLDPLNAWRSYATVVHADTGKVS